MRRVLGRIGRLARKVCGAAGLALLCGLPAEAVDRSLGHGVDRPAIGGVPWSSDATRGLRRDLDALLDGAPALRGAHVGFLVVDTRSGTVLYARNADDAFMPASTLKLLTGSVALAVLGPAFRLHTEALVDAPASALYLRGGGDPLLMAADLGAMARAVRAAGVTRLRDGVFIDASALESAPYPPGWSWDDLAYDYAPVVSALTVEENVVHLTVTPGASAGQRADVTGAPAPFDRRFGSPIEGCPLTHAVVVIPRAQTGEPGSPDTLDLRRDLGGCITISGTIAAGSSPETLDAAVPSASWYARAIARAALANAGVATGELAAVAGPVESADGAAFGVPAGAHVVWSHDGEPLSDLLADLWWPSDNLVAELLLRTCGRLAAAAPAPAAAPSGGVPAAVAVGSPLFGDAPGTTENGAAVERAWLRSIGVDPATLTIADGSGLSTYDRITPRALVAILQADWNGPSRDLVIDDLPLAGVRGTLQHDFIGTPAERRTFAKTGSVNHTRGLAGYLATLHHGALTFAWSVDDWMGTQADLDALRGVVLARLIGD